MEYKLLLFDLDGTLLRSDKSISEYTLSVLDACRSRGMMIGVSTSRSEQNSRAFLSRLLPDILISSGGAVVKRGNDVIYKAEFSAEETNDMIRTAREVCGGDCEISIDTLERHYWNYKTDPKKQDQSWGDTIHTDFKDFSQKALKMCVEIFDDNRLDELKNRLPQCDCVRFSDGCWYKFTKKEATKENAILEACAACEIALENVMAFGDDFADIGMLKLCGAGIAMGNAIEEVKRMADAVIGRNDDDGIAEYLVNTFKIKEIREKVYS